MSAHRAAMRTGASPRELNAPLAPNDRSRGAEGKSPSSLTDARRSRDADLQSVGATSCERAVRVHAGVPQRAHASRERSCQAPSGSRAAVVVPEGSAPRQTVPVELPQSDDADPSACQVFAKEKGFWVFYAFCCVGCVISLFVVKTHYPHHFNKVVKLESIPIVSVLFTWGHIWLAVQMMFYPVKFWGCWNFRNSGYGIGWQGVVPRKAGKMAETTCELMLGRIISMEEIVDRFHMDDFFATFESVLMECQRKVNDRLGAQHFPSLWTRIPQSVKDEILDKVMECSKDSFQPIMSDIRSNIKSILDIKDMAVTRYTNEPRLLIGLFQKVGTKEFAFIQRTGAQMGLFLGLGQMALYFVTERVKWMPWVLLPVSGLIIGNLTNWLAIKMIFKPTHPHLMCGGRINIQGLFLKRQKVVSKVLARMLVDICLNSDEMVRYLISSPGYEGALEIFHRHAARACDGVLGPARRVAPVVVGPDQYESLRRCAVDYLLEELPNHKAALNEYVDAAFQIEETIGTRLSRLPPDQFEGMLHPAFQEDEWMLILLGGVLGVVVGLFQAAVLGT